MAGKVWPPAGGGPGVVEAVGRPARATKPRRPRRSTAPADGWRAKRTIVSPPPVSPGIVRRERLGDSRTTGPACPPLHHACHPEREGPFLTQVIDVNKSVF